MYHIVGVFGCIVFMCAAVILGFGIPELMSSESFWIGAPAPMMWAAWVMGYTLAAFLMFLAGAFAVMAWEG